MPDYAITISRDSKGNVTFDPSPCRVRAGDIISWRNTDKQAHWPGKADDDGKVVDEKFYMEFQIPEGGTSTGFSFNTPGTYTYACSLHTCDGEVGTIEVKTNS